MINGEVETLSEAVALLLQMPHNGAMETFHYHGPSYTVKAVINGVDEIELRRVSGEKGEKEYPWDITVEQGKQLMNGVSEKDQLQSIHLVSRDQRKVYSFIFSLTSGVIAYVTRRAISITDPPPPSKLTLRNIRDKEKFLEQISKIDYIFKI